MLCCDTALLGFQVMLNLCFIPFHLAINRALFNIPSKFASFSIVKPTKTIPKQRILVEKLPATP